MRVRFDQLGYCATYYDGIGEACDVMRLAGGRDAEADADRKLRHSAQIADVCLQIVCEISARASNSRD